MEPCLGSPRSRNSMPGEVEVETLALLASSIFEVDDCLAYRLARRLLHALGHDARGQVQGAPRERAEQEAQILRRYVAVVERPLRKVEGILHSAVQAPLRNSVVVYADCDRVVTHLSLSLLTFVL